MIRRHRFFSVFSLLSSLCVFAAEGGGAGSPPPTLEDQLTQARADLTTAQTSVQTADAERDTAIRERDEARQEVTRLTEQFNTATAAATTSQRERDEARTQLSAVTIERDTAQRDLCSANTNITRLETLCGVKGIDPKSAVPAAGDPGATNTRDELVTALNSAKTPADRGIAANKLREYDAAQKSAV